MNEKESYEALFEHRNSLLDAQEIEEDLRLAHGTIHTWIYRGTMPFPFIRVRGRIRVRKEALVRWLMQQEVQPGGEQKPIPRQPESGKKRRGRPPKVKDLAREAAHATN